MENSEKKLIKILKDIKMEFVLLNLLIILDFIFIEAVNLLAASDPEASVDDIKYGGNLYEEDIDDQ